VNFSFSPFDSNPAGAFASSTGTFLFGAFAGSNGWRLYLANSALAASSSGVQELRGSMTISLLPP